MVAKSHWCLVAILCGLIFSLFDGIDGLYCFQCNSQRDEGCFHLKVNDTRSPYYKECKIPHLPKKEGTPYYAIPPERFCRKTYQKIFDRGGIEVIERKCGWMLHEEEDCYYTSTVGHKESVCQCFSDGCNSSERTTSVATVLIILMVILNF